MQSRNPVFARSAQFNGRANAYGNPTYAGNGRGYEGFGSAPSWSPTHEVGQGRMTIDSVVQRTAMTLGLTVLVAAATWLLTGNVADPAAFGGLYALTMVGALGGFVLSMVNSFKRVISPALVLAYAALEGLAVGGLSKVIAGMVGDPSVVIGAVVGTFAAVAGTLAAYRFFDIKVGDRFRKWTMAMVLGFVGVSLLDFVLSLFHASFGFNGFGTLGLISSVLGLGIGVLMLILDFDFVERGVAAGLPERESWRAAFGLTVTIVWLYIEMLRLLAILRGE